MSRGRLLLFLFTAVVFLLGAFALIAEAPPLWVPWTLGAAYLALVGAGAMNLRLEMFGDALCSVPAAKGRVALTFDDGPDPISTPIVLAELRKAGAKATFFVVGKKVAMYPDVIKAIADEGHSLGVHGYVHNRLYAFLPPKEVARDIERSRDAIESAAELRPIWFRPPVGQMSPRTARGVELCDAFVVGWSVKARDGVKNAVPETCLQRIVKGLRSGAIVLLHDAWERREVANLADGPAGIRMLPALLRECSSRGLKCVTLEEMLSSKDSA